MDGEDDLWKTCQVQPIPTPFRFFAAPWPHEIPSAPFPFPRIVDLPLEVLGVIFGFCDASTLFSLMRSCRLIRSMTSRLFWSNSFVWYRIPENWWVSQRFNRPQSCCLNMNFARHVSQIEIVMGRLEWEFAHPQESCNQWPHVTPENKAIIFWRAVQHSFPLARNITLLAYPLRSRTPPPNGEYDTGYTPIAVLLQHAPQEINATVSCERGFAQVAPPIWKFDKSKTPQLQPAQKPSLVKRVLPPSRQLPEGPLRDYEFMCNTISTLGSEHRGLRLLRKETHARFTGDRGIECPNTNCTAVLNDRHSWETHVSNFRDRRDCANSSEEHYAENTPLHIRESLDVKQARISVLHFNYEQTWLKLRRAMGESDTQRRQEFVNTIDKLAEKLYPPTDEASNRARREYLHGGFWSYFDPTHVYYSPALPGFDNGIAASPDTISYECESESSDSSDWGGPFVDIELEKRMKQRYDNFWRNAGFKL